MTNELLPSIQTLSVSTPPAAPSSATVNRVVAEIWNPDIGFNPGIGFDLVAGVAQETAGQIKFTPINAGGCVLASDLFADLQSPEFITVNALEVAEPKAFAFAEVYHSISKAISGKWLTLAAGGAFSTSPMTATLGVLDKKYSEVFEKINLLRNRDPDEGPCATDFTYWNCVKVVANAYGLLRAEHPHLSKLPSPTVLADDWGGIRLIWRTANKVVRANFGGRVDLKSYLYHESGQVYGVEPLDARTLATRLGWLL